MRILLVGGGTGGHLYPILSLARALLSASANSESHQILIVGTRAALDERLLSGTGARVAMVESSPMSRESVARAARGAVANVRAIARALAIVRKFRPHVVVATGGYASVGVVLAAGMLRGAPRFRAGPHPRMQIALLEPNVEPGRANRLLARFADEIWGAYDATAQYFGRKFVRTGIPVRAELLRPADRTAARRSLGLDPAAATILVFGGSQGARSINAATSAMAARRRLPRDWQIIHVSGHRDYEWMATERKAEPNDNRYLLLPYADEMSPLYAAADVAVCRAGASTLAELAAVGMPSILVPYPHAADDHQRKNAAVFERAGAAVAVGDETLDADLLYWLLVDSLSPQALTSRRAAARSLASPDALQTIVERILGGKIGQS